MKTGYRLFRAMGIGALALLVGIPAPVLVNLAQADQAPNAGGAPAGRVHNSNQNSLAPSASSAPTPASSSSTGSPPAGSGAAAPPPPPSQDCSASCDEYFKFQGATKESKSMGAVAAYCGDIPADPDAKDMNGKPMGEGYTDCKNATITRFRALGPYCDTLGAYSDAETAEMMVAIAYSAATLVCLASCYGTLGITGGICTAAALVATGLDLYQTISLYTKGEDKTGFWTQALGDVGLVGGLGGSVGAIVAQATAKGATEGAKQGASKGTEEGAKKAADKTACYVTTAMLAASAILKWVDYGIVVSNKGDSCKQVSGLAGYGEAPTMAVVKAPGASQGGPPPVAKGTASATGAGTHTVGGGGAISKIPTGGDEFPDVMTSAATAGPAGELFKGLNLNRTPAELKAATGLTLQDLGKKMMAGESLASLAAGIDGMPQSGPDLMNKMDELVKSGDIAEQAGSTASSRGGGGGGGGGDKKDTGFNFGMKGPGGGGPKETSFDGKKKAAALGDSTDIWHEGYAGSIFQIVSQKLVKTTDRIEQLEWATPLNRALAGLPKAGTKPSQLPPILSPSSGRGK